MSERQTGDQSATVELLEQSQAVADEHKAALGTERGALPKASGQLSATSTESGP